jgi:hypothetical protein
MGVDRVRQLKTRARVWAGAAPADWVRRLPAIRFLGVGHGTLPTDRSFGARRLPVDGVAGHYDYFRPGTGSLRAMAAIVLGEGHADAVDPAPTSPTRTPGSSAAPVRRGAELQG